MLFFIIHEAICTCIYEESFLTRQFITQTQELGA